MTIHDEVAILIIINPITYIIIAGKKTIFDTISSTNLHLKRSEISKSDEMLGKKHRLYKTYLTIGSRVS